MDLEGFLKKVLTRNMIMIFNICHGFLCSLKGYAAVSLCALQ